MALVVTKLKAIGRDCLYYSIVDTLEHLPERLRKVFILSHYQGKSAGEMATLFQTSVGEIQELLDEANRRFYRLLRLHRNRIQL